MLPFLYLSTRDCEPETVITRERFLAVVESDEDLVSTTTYELASPEEAAEMLKKSLDAPMSVPVQTINLTQLGDEAYMRLNKYAKEADLFFRKGNVVIIMSASTPGLAQRFARHLANEIH